MFYTFIDLICLLAKITSFSTSTIKAGHGSNQVTIAECMQRKNNKYSLTSTEYKLRIEAVQNMMIDTGCPTNILNRTSFKEMLRIYDPHCPAFGM
jgi:hypothetical protein